MSETKPEKESPKKVEIRVTDRRPRFDATDKEDAEQPLAPETRYPTFVAELESRLRASENKLREALDLLRRREVEADEFRARLRKEMDRRSRAQVENFLNEILEALDSLDRGISSSSSEPDGAILKLGLSKVRDQFLAALARQGVTPMDLLHTTFDPKLAEALALADAKGTEQENRVVAEIRRGYTWDDQVLRTAQVQVARRKTSGSTSRQEEVTDDSSRPQTESTPAPERKP